MQTLHLDKVEYTEKILEKSYQWLHDNELKILPAMPGFTREEHQRWFQALKEKKDYLIYGITDHKIPIGVSGIKHIDLHRAEYWGKSLGKWMIGESFKESRARNLNSLYLKS